MVKPILPLYEIKDEAGNLVSIEGVNNRMPRESGKDVKTDGYAITVTGDEDQGIM